MVIFVIASIYAVLDNYCNNPKSNHSVLLIVRGSNFAGDSIPSPWIGCKIPP